MHPCRPSAPLSIPGATHAIRTATDDRARAPGRYGRAPFTPGCRGSLPDPGCGRVRGGLRPCHVATPRGAGHGTRDGVLGGAGADAPARDLPGTVAGRLGGAWTGARVPAGRIAGSRSRSPGAGDHHAPPWLGCEPGGRGPEHRGAAPGHRSDWRGGAHVALRYGAVRAGRHGRRERGGGHPGDGAGATGRAAARQRRDRPHHRRRGGGAAGGARLRARAPLGRRCGLWC
jgi:hypothetical protein